jgi:hypothetical protein
MPNFIEEIQLLHAWLDTEAQLLTREDIIDKVKVALISMVQRFLSYPHCSNFALMPQPSQT